MSFSKAKIQRFNDIKADCTPSPARYNISLQEKVKLGTIPKAGKYSKKPGSPHSSEGSSVHSTPCFQTPTLPVRKKKILGMSFKSATKHTDTEELREKIVECNNKDLYIKDLFEQVEEMTGRINALQKENIRLRSEKEETCGALQVQRVREFSGISSNLKDVNTELKHIRRQYQDLKNQNFVELSKLLAYIQQFDEMHNKMLEEHNRILELLKDEHSKERSSFEKKLQECENEKEEIRHHYLVQIENLKQQQNEDKLRDCHRREEIRQNYLEELQNLRKSHSEEKTNLELKLQESIKSEENIKQHYLEELEMLKKQQKEEREETQRQLAEREAKILLLEENFKDVNLLTELQMKQKIEEVEDLWKQKLADKERESNEILRECQEISEYSIIECEIEKNQIKKELESKIQDYDEITNQYKILQEEINTLKTEKHAYELSLTTFKDTIEVLKKRLISSDRDVIQLKEELESSEEKILNYERKCMELTNQLSETQMANEELEMQYESTSKLMQNQVENIEKKLLTKVEMLKQESQQLQKDKELLNDVLAQHHEQQILISKAQAAIAESNSVIESLENKQIELEFELKHYKEDAEEVAEIRKKYIEKSGKLDELAQQFEQVLQELDQTKSKIEELEEQLEFCKQELKVVNEEKETIANEAKELSLKYAELLGHKNHSQKIKYVQDLRIKQSELFEKNMELESTNYKLNKLIDKLMKENDDLRKKGKKKIGAEDKENLASPKCIKGENLASPKYFKGENLASPKCIKGTESPGPLKDKN